MTAISDFFPHQRPHFKKISRQVGESDKQCLFEKLSGSASCPMEWFIGAEPISVVQSETSSNESVQIGQLHELFKEDHNKFCERCSASNEQITWMAENSSEQHRSSLWESTDIFA